ncbi:MAG: site-specific DNA-methyltransferase [Treponema sp.]|nr:site-specific DNA-methyltransferase [Treponema sp.]
MELIYPNKKSENDILGFLPSSQFSIPLSDNSSLINGNNLEVLLILLHEYNMAGKVDLIYIDPPFATNGTFTIGKERTSTISGSVQDDIAYTDTLVGEEFIEFLRERLILARELLSEKGSIYLHIDYKIGHYVKVIMDEVFGSKNFRNDITRIKCNPNNFSRKAYGNIKDLILFYSKSENPIWNEPFIPYSEEDIAKLYKKIDKNGRFYTTVPLHAPGETKDGVTGGEFKGIKPPKGRHWRTSPAELEKLDEQGLIEWSANGVPRRKIFAEEQKGKRVQDIWDFKDYQYPAYPTEKNLDLLKHIIKTSSNEDSLVMDFFCGSGTTLCAAQELGRKWIGIDQSEQAIKVAINRLSKIQDTLFENNKFDFIELESNLPKEKNAM